MLIIVKDMIGCLRDIFLFSLNFLAVSIILMTSLICSLITSFNSRSLTSGIETWWMDYWWSLLSFLITNFKFWYMLSVKKGTKGLISTLTFNNTSKRTFKLTFISFSSIYPLSLCLFILTYQLVKCSKKVISEETTL